MEIKKLYFNKLYNQWRDFPFIYEKLNEGLCVRVLGIEYNKDIIDNITANFKDLDNIDHFNNVDDLNSLKHINDDMYNYVLSCSNKSSPSSSNPFR